MHVLDMIKAIVVLIVIAAVGKVLPARAITVDGVFSDWTDQQIGIEAAGDVGAGDMVDWLTAWARFENSALYISYKTQRNIDFAGMPGATAFSSTSTPSRPRAIAAPAQSMRLAPITSSRAPQFTSTRAAERIGHGRRSVRPPTRSPAIAWKCGSLAARSA